MSISPTNPATSPALTDELRASVAAKTVAVQALLSQIAHEFNPAVFASSLGAEDMVLTDLIVKSK